MPIYPKPPIEHYIPISDVVENGTIVKRKALPTRLTYDIWPATKVTIGYFVHAFSHDPAAPDGYGPRTGSAIFREVDGVLGSSNARLVEQATGTILSNMTGFSQEQVDAAKAEHEQMVTMWQEDHFALVAEFQPVKINDEVRKYIINAEL